MTCKNCGREFDDNFCPNCGQSTMGNRRLDLFALFRKFIDDHFDLHGGYFYTLWKLFTVPGEVGRNYVNGKRKRYTAPTRFLIITVAFQALIDFLSEADRLIREFDIVFAPFVPEKLLVGMQYYNFIFGTEYALSVNILEIALFPIAFNIFFRKLNYNYTELLVVSFYYISVALLSQIVLSFILRHVFGLYISGDFITIYMMVVLSWTYVRFFDDSKPFLRLIKVLGALLIIVLVRVYFVPLLFSILFPVQSIPA